MGILDSMISMAENSGSNEADHAVVAGGLLQEIGGPAGVAGLIQSLHQNGAGEMVQQWASGQTQGMDPVVIEDAIGRCGIADKIAQRTGISADAVRSGIATVVPILVHHMVTCGHVTAEGQPTGSSVPESGTLLQSVLGKIL